MYIIVNGDKYENVKTKFAKNEIHYYGASLIGIESVSGTISTYTNADFLLREDNVADYLRSVVGGGEIILTNTPEPEPPVPPTPVPDMWDEMADAIKEGVNSVD